MSNRRLPISVRRSISNSNSKYNNNKWNSSLQLNLHNFNPKHLAPMNKFIHKGTH